MPDDTHNWDKKKFLDEVIQSMYGTTMTFQEYYDSHPNFRDTVDRIHTTCERARASGDPKAHEKLAAELKAIANEIRERQ